MDYEKKYKEALGRAKKLYEQGTITESLSYVFDELAESENERIRKAQLDYWRSVGGKEWHGVPIQETIAWLEKQSQVKEYTFKSLPRLLEMIEPTSRAKAYCQKLIDTLVNEGYNVDAKIVGECLKQMDGEKVALATMDEKQGEHKPKWTEEDEKNWLGVIDEIEANKSNAPDYDLKTYDRYLSWLESLKRRMQ